jgi:hypothetical protein
VSSAHDIGAVALIEVGAKCYSRTRQDVDGYPLGGLVVEVLDDVDRETGEVVRAYRTLSHAGARPPIEHRLSVSEVDPTTVQPVSMFEALKMLRRLCQEIGASKHRSFDVHELERIADIGRLARLLRGGIR